MKLAVIRANGSKKPSEQLRKTFSEKEEDILDIPVPKRTDGTKVQYIEDSLKANDFDLYSPDTFLLGSRYVLTEGEAVSRNSLNYGIVVDPSLSNIRFGDTDVLLSHAVELPYRGNPKTLVVIIHPDNEPWMFIGHGHSMLEHPMHLLAAMKWGDERDAEIERLYNDPIIFNAPYTILDIPDKSLAYSRSSRVGFEKRLEESIDAFEPDVIVQTAPGKNEDHTEAYRITRKLLDGTGISLILGDNIEAGAWEEHGELKTFTPNLWQIVNGNVVDYLMTNYEKLGESQYIEQVSNLTRRKEPVGNSKLFSYLINNVRKRRDEHRKELHYYMLGRGTIEEEMALGSYGLQVVDMHIDPDKENTGYRVPHLTEFLNRRDLTK